MAPGYAFRHPGLDRAEQLREDAAALDRLWPTATILAVDGEGRIRHRGADDAPHFQTGAEFASERPVDATFLGLDPDQAAWFVVPVEASDGPPATIQDLRSAGTCWPDLPAAAFAQARALLHWQRHSRHCGACGTALTRQRAGYSARCAQCGVEHYPRTDPAVIVAVSDGERLLLGRQASWPEKRWSVLAGFLEPGESLEQTVIREVMEEAGVRVRQCRYAASQPWPFPAALMLGFQADADPQPVRVGEELQDARWFSGPELRTAVAAGEVLLSPRLSISRWLIEEWLATH